MKRQLGPFEAAQVITSEHSPLNLVIVLRMNNGPGPKVLQHALKVLNGRHPLLKAGILQSGSNYFYNFSEQTQIEFELTPRSSNFEWHKQAERELNKSFRLATGPLLRVMYLPPEGHDSACELILTAHHAIIDGQSAARLLHDLLGLCASFTGSGDSVNYDIMGTLPAADQLFPKQHQGWHGWLKKLAFSRREFMAMYRYRRQTRDQQEPSIEPEGRCQIVSFQLPAKLTDALITHCKEHRISLNSLLCAAQLLIARHHQYGSSEAWLRHFHFADLRPYLKPAVGPEHLGSYISMLHQITLVEAGTGLWDLAKTLAAQIRQANRDGDKFVSAQLSKSLMNAVLKFRKQRMAHAAMAFMGTVDLDDHYGQTEITGLHSYVSNLVLGPVYTANTRLFQGQLWWDMIYLDCDMDQDTAKSLARKLIQLLSAPP